MKSLVKSLASLLYMAVIAIAIAGIFQFNAYAVFSVLVAASFIPMPKGSALMPLQKEIWEKDIIDNLFKSNQFAERAYNADEFVLAGKVVHSPVAGAPTKVKKNLDSFPQIAVDRADSEQTYAIDTYYALPRRIAEIDKYELSYDKRQSVVGEDEAQLIQEAMDGLLYRWAPNASNVIPTTGAAAAATIPGATGNRKVFTKDVFGQVKVRMDVANIMQTGRVALLTAYHHQQLLDSFSDVEKANFNAMADMKNGIVGRYLGFDIMMRSSVQRYRKANGVWVPVDEQVDDWDDQDKTGDSAASLFYQEKAVERARGDVQVFDNPGQAIYYGDIFSALLRLGGRIRRLAGVYAIVEDIAA